MSSTTDYSIENFYKKESMFESGNLSTCPTIQNQKDGSCPRIPNQQYEKQININSDVAFLKTLDYMLNIVAPKVLQKSSDYVDCNLRKRSSIQEVGIKNDVNQIGFVHTESCNSIIKEISPNKKLFLSVMKHQNMLYNKNSQLEIQLEKSCENNDDSNLNYITYQNLLQIVVNCRDPVWLWV